jgi:replicative superfamily II helicase
VRIDELTAQGAPEALVDAWSQTITELTPVQERAVAAGALGGASNLLVVAPTTSGKTFVGEMGAATAAYQTRRQALFLVPFRALADEHFELFRERYGDLLSVVISTSDWGQFDADIRSGNFGLGVLTYEKLTGLLVSRPQLLGESSVLVVDEVQMMRDRGRGPALELMLTQVMLAKKHPQLIALSASLDDLNSLDQWLDAVVVQETERPIPLEEGVVAPGSGRVLIRRGGDLGQHALFGGGADKEDAIGRLCAQLVAEEQQVLVFRSSPAKAYKAAEVVATFLPAGGLTPATAGLLEGLESSDTLESQRKLLASGVGFHTADLPTGERRAVERSFRSGDTKVIVSSGTQAMGVNLPTDVVVVADTIRFIANRWDWTREAISVSDYKNQVGRAGRLGQRARGLGLLVADSDPEQRQLFDIYCDGAPEPVKSQLPTAEFDDVVFRVLAADLAATTEELVEFLASTFAFLTFWQLYGGVSEVERGVADAIDACLSSGLVREDRGKLTVTRAGRVFAGHGIPLRVAVQLSQLVDALDKEALPTSEVVHRIATCDSLFERRPFTKWDRGSRRLHDPRGDLGIEIGDLLSSHHLSIALAAPPREDREARALLRTGCLLQWVDGTSERDLSRRFDGCGHARLTAMGQTAAWLADAAVRVAAVRQVDRDRVDEFRRLALSLRHGLPHELAPLARLDAPGIGRATLSQLLAGDNGRQLYDPDNLLDAGVDELDGLLTPAQTATLQAAIVVERGESLGRRRRAHHDRATRSQIDARLIDDLYTAAGAGLEQAVTDALESVGLAVTRIVRQPQGEEDIQLDHPDGTVVISVTASDSETKGIRWNKAREVLGTGAGLDPINYVCIGRPGFHSLAERQAGQIAREVGARRLLLVPVHVLADAVLRCQEVRLAPEQLGELLAYSRGLLDLESLDAIEDDSGE